MAGITLNVGCGEDLRGDIRLDKEKTGAANIVAAAEFLPFRSKSFSFVFSLSVLEHIPSWKQAFQEILRVSRSKVLLEVPVNSDLRKTEFLRLLFPTLKNLRLFFSMPRRARETLWQMNPIILLNYMRKSGFACMHEKVFHLYHGVPSRCWRIRAWRIF
jgi:ubiquinone/menaquinone biosynthesis C-methylase UbiE